MAPYVALIALLTLLASFGGGYWKGHRDADQSSAVESLSSKLETAQATLKLQEEETKRLNAQVGIANRKAEASAKDADALQRQVSDYEHKIDRRAGCILSDRDALGLRQLKRSSTQLRSH